MIKKKGLVINGIYQHWKQDHFYLVKDVCFHHEDNNKAIVTYYRCDEKGMYKSFRDKNGNPSVNQPFYREYESFVENVNVGLKVIPRFKFVKSCS